MDSPQSHSILSASGTPASDAPQQPTRATMLPCLAFRKPPRPALPRPLYLCAYAKPIEYNIYIELVLTPATFNAARSSLTTMAEPTTLAVLRKENGGQFADQVAHELKQQISNAPEVWVRETLFATGAPDKFKDFFLNSDAWKKTRFWRMPEFTEDGVKGWLTDLVKFLGETFPVISADGSQRHVRAPVRSWSSATANSPPSGGTQSRKPDLILLDNEICVKAEDKKIKPGWALIKAFIEVTQNQHSVFTNMLTNIVQKAYLMFESQPYRRYVIALAFVKKERSPSWTLIVVDRSGVITTTPFSFTRTNGITLAMVLYCLCFGSVRSIGIDETMTLCKETGVVTHITVTGETPTSGKKRVTRIFEVVRPIHNVPQLSGRATHVWLVRRKDIYYILKDSWPLGTKPFSEIRHLLKINQTIMQNPAMYAKLKHTYPILVVGQELPDETGDYRVELTDSFFSRVHRRIVTKPIADPLTSFSSKFELCSVLCDVVQYLKFSSEDCSVCHGDISLTNVGIHHVWSDYQDQEVDGDDVQDTCIEDIKSKNHIIVDPTKADMNKKTSHNVDDLHAVPETDAISTTEAHIVSESHVISPITATPTPSGVTSPDNAATIARSDDTTITSPDAAAAITSPDAAAAITSPDAAAAITSTNDAAIASPIRPVPVSAHGLVIDYDNSFSLDEIEEYGYRANSGTLPFMALESLDWDTPEEFTHAPRHDLESLFYVILAICTYVNAPGSLRSSTPIENERSLCVNEWWSTLDCHLLVRNKAQHITSMDKYILQRLPPYWKDFHQELRDLREAIWPGKDTNVLTAKNEATHDGFLKVLTKAREKFRDNGEVPAQFAPVTDRQIAYNAAQKRKGKDSDAYVEVKRSKTLADTTLSLNRNRASPHRSSPASGSIRRTSARLAGASAGPGI